MRSQAVRLPRDERRVFASIKGDQRRGKGLNPNGAMRLDEHTKTAPLTDPIGGSASFYDTRVKVVKV